MLEINFSSVVPLLVNICRQAEIGADRAMEFDRLASAHSEYGGEDEPSNQHNPWVEEPSFLNVAAGHAQLLFQGVMFAISWHTTLLSILTVTSCARAIRLWPGGIALIQWKLLDAPLPVPFSWTTPLVRAWEAACFRSRVPLSHRRRLCSCAVALIRALCR